MRYLKLFEGFMDVDKIKSALDDIFIAFSDDYDIDYCDVKVYDLGEGPSLQVKKKSMKLFGLGEQDRMIKVRVNLKSDVFRSGKSLKISDFSDEVLMSLDYLEELGPVDFYFIIDHQFSPSYCERMDDMRDKLQNPYFNGSLIELYFIIRG